MNDPKIYAVNNKYGFIFDVNHPQINILYRRYEKWKGIPAGFPMKDSERREFERYLLKIYPPD